MKVIEINKDTGEITVHGMPRDTGLNDVMNSLGCNDCRKGHVAKEFPVLQTTSEPDADWDVTRTLACWAISGRIVNPPGLLSTRQLLPPLNYQKI